MTDRTINPELTVRAIAPSAIRDGADVAGAIARLLRETSRTDPGYEKLREAYGVALDAAGLSVEHVCPDCGVERADYEGPGAHLITCPYCNSDADPVPTVEETR
jgi:hypothetical protein